MRGMAARFCKNQKGTTAIEYAFICILVSVGIVTALIVIGSTLSPIFSSVSNNLKTS